MKGKIIQEKIFSIRGQQVILDKDLAELYQISLSQLHQQVQRNIKRFPKNFMFQLTAQEWNALKGGDQKLPFAFTEHGVAMLSSVLNSAPAIHMNRNIIRELVSSEFFKGCP
ncbi:MAG: hypothetical protein A3D92_10085 [Bacteroidetes bacterium RIFCSPHIGHO2_02_FULL_44_7]|nr:MAG: hypothetical protein A3D92_10085 [Bacteroidetes bacterium RIFCSPHIGHO2_02_FULL_44_7]